MDEGRFLISADDLCQRLGSAAVLLDGKVLFTTTDKTLADLGKVALRTKADSVTRLDAIEITPPPYELSCNQEEDRR